MDRAEDVLAGCRLVDVDVTDESLEDVAAADEWVEEGWHKGRGSRACCEGKQRYGKRAAHRAARKLNWAQNEGVHAYPCPFGQHWHVGHLPFAKTNMPQLIETA